MIHKSKTGRANINFYNCDNMEFMASKPDNYYDLAIVDPPYFSGPERRKFYGNSIGKSKHSKTGSINKIKRIEYSISKKWKVPNELYFNELFRVSKNQIIWGVNYYKYYFSPGRIVWDKVNYKSSFSDCEIAFSSMHDSARIFKYMWNGMMQGKSIKQPEVQQGNKTLNEKRIHPTQKPVKLYEWLLHNYAKPGNKILDTHGGSASIALACWNLGYDLDLCELDKDYFKDSWQRFEIHTQQTQLF